MSVSTTSNSPFSPIKNGALGEQRRPALLDVFDDGVSALDVEIRLELAGERGVGQIDRFLPTSNSKHIGFSYECGNKNKLWADNKHNSVMG